MRPFRILYFLRRITKAALPRCNVWEKYMKLFGLDIGTTTVSAVVVDNGSVIASRTLDNGAFLSTPHAWEKIQDVAAIRFAAFRAMEELLSLHPDVSAIGITGQMHGILYLDGDNRPLSPLYIWQDGRGDLPYRDGLSYAAWLRRETGYAVATGYGLVTHFYNLKNGLVPESAVTFCTIHDYIAMLLSSCPRPLTDASDAASLGFFDVERGCFDTAALEKLGMDISLLPALASSPKIGYYKNIPVYVAIGDNQASFLGATGGSKNTMLVNVGTGSQFSAYTPDFMACPGLETRPFPGGGYLLVGAPLCGGRAYALLEGFLRATAEAMAGTKLHSCYEAMAALLAQGRPENLPAVDARFQGTRQEPGLRGSITGLSTENFTPQHLIWALMEGMAGELWELCSHYLAAGGKSAPLIGSGNGLRKNIYLQDCFSRAFGQALSMSECNEEAATGAAVFAGSHL